jgi:hypothetical protein
MCSQNNYNLAHIVAARKNKTAAALTPRRFSLSALSGTLRGDIF